MTRSISFAAVLACTLVSSLTANTCRDVRREFDCRLDSLADEFRETRRDLHRTIDNRMEELRCELRRAYRLSAHEREHRVREIKSAMKCAARDFHIAMERVECDYKRRRDAIRYEREITMRNCRRGGCGHGRSVPPGYVHDPFADGRGRDSHYEFGIPEHERTPWEHESETPRSWENNRVPDEPIRHRESANLGEFLFDLLASHAGRRG